MMQKFKNKFTESQAINLIYEQNTAIMMFDNNYATIVEC